jgi:peptidoglycan/LPS O-acetylase OafA/YrhL
VPKPAKGPHLTYRPGLDGLRALAVIGVFLYHAKPHGDGDPWVRGGFLGVDLFFVLSGFLITSILLVEWEHHHRIKLLRFWARRARRLFPALVVVVFATLLLSAIFARADLGPTRTDTLSSLLYFNNWHQILANHSYFVRTGNPSLLQHVWSLAVEEQFYVIWPLVLVPGLIFLGRKRLPYAIIGGILGSAALMWLLYKPAPADPSRVYYGTDTRAFLLLMGILVALWWPSIKRIPRELLEVLGVLALATTIYVFFTMPDPSFNATYFRGGDLLSAFCFAVLIAAVAHPASRLDRALGIVPLRWLGERSYGIYLWHLPIIYLTRPDVDLSWSGPLAVIGQATIIVAAAALSFRFVEQPIRTGRVQEWLAGVAPRRRAEVVAAGVVAVIAAFAILYVAPSATTAQASPPPPPPKHHHHKRHGGHPPTHHHKTKSHLPPGRMLALGDSVMLGCSSELETALDYRVHVDAAVSRQIDDVIAELHRIRHKYGTLPKTVIVQVGNNGPLLYDGLVQLKAALRGVPDVVVVNVRNARPWESESNSAITDWTHGWRAAHIADWYGNSTDKMLSDGTHPWPYACHIYAHVIATTLRGTTA